MRVTNLPRNPCWNKSADGAHGAPQLKQEEQQRYWVSSASRYQSSHRRQINEPESMKKSAQPWLVSAQTVINGRPDSLEAAEYIRLARQHNLFFHCCQLPGIQRDR